MGRLRLHGSPSTAGCGSTRDEAAGARRTKWSSDNSGSAARQLTEAERRVVHVIAEGHTEQSAAKLLGISENTVGTHIRSAYTKLGVQSRVQLANALRDLAELDCPAFVGSRGDGVHGALLITTGRRRAKAMSPADRRVWSSHASHPSLARRHRQASATLAGRRVLVLCHVPVRRPTVGARVSSAWSGTVCTSAGQAVDTGGRDRE